MSSKIILESIFTTLFSFGFWSFNILSQEIFKHDISIVKKITGKYKNIFRLLFLFFLLLCRFLNFANH